MSKILPLLFILLFLASGCEPDDAQKPQQAAPVAQGEENAPAKALTPPEESAQEQKAQEQNTEEAAVIAENPPSLPETPATEREQTPPVPLPEVADNNVPLTPKEREKADKILAYCNQAIAGMQRGYFTLPDTLYGHTLFYKQTFHLPKRPKIPSRATAVSRLTPPAGIFNQQEAKELTSGLDEMDQALGKMLGNYKELAKYVGDDSIRDDGKRGKELADLMDKDHADFMKARRTWLRMVDANAAKAEQALLRQHPLQRQILAASGIFTQFREAAHLLNMESPDTAMLGAVNNSIQGLLATAKKPPFNASPDLERLYRGFLREVQDYSAALQRGLEEGFFGAQKREIAIAAQKCRAAYNKFAEASNRLGK